MKKLILVSVLLLGAASASQAGVRFNLGFGLPLPPLPGVVISQPAPVYQAPPAYYAPPQAYCPPTTAYYGAAPVIVEPPSVVFGFGGYGGYGYRYPHYYGGWGHRGWNYGHGHGWHR